MTATSPLPDPLSEGEGEKTPESVPLIPALHSNRMTVTMLALLDSIRLSRPQAQQMQEKMAREMEELRVDASAGGGVVTVEMKGNHEIISLKIDPEIVKEGDVEMLQDMIAAALNEANRKVDEAMKGKLGAMLPPGLGNLF